MSIRRQGDRAADRPLHPRHRHARRAGRGGSRRRDPGRVVATPVERGHAVPMDAELIRISPAEARGAGAPKPKPTPRRSGAARARAAAATFEIDRVPEVANARAHARPGARRFRPRARCCSRRSCSRRPSSIAQRAGRSRRGASTRSRATARCSRTRRCSRPRRALTLARKALADTVVRAPFDGVVGERLVSVGDYVTRGTKVASVMRIEPAARRADGAGAVHRRGRRRPRGVVRGRCRVRGRRSRAQVRYVSPGARRPTRAR